MIKAIFFDMGGVICEEGFKPCPKAYEKEFGVPANVFYTAIHDHQAWKDFTLGKVSEEEYLKVCKERIRKPDKELFDFAVKNAGVKPEECIYVDDRPDRIGGAEELGIKVVVFDGNMANFKKLINKFN